MSWPPPLCGIENGIEGVVFLGGVLVVGVVGVTGVTVGGTTSGVIGVVGVNTLGGV
jgi:hypothetical protein